MDKDTNSKTIDQFVIVGDPVLLDFVHKYGDRYHKIINSTINFCRTNGFMDPDCYFDCGGDCDCDMVYISMEYPDSPDSDTPFFRVLIEIHDNYYYTQGDYREYDLRIDLLLHDEEQFCSLYRDGIEINPNPNSVDINFNDYLTYIHNWVDNRVDPWD